MPHGHPAIGTQLLSTSATHEAGYPWSEHVPLPGRDATLLAVVPIPGTQTSLAIVGYAISTSDPPEPGPAANQVPLEPKPEPKPEPEPATGLLIDHPQRRVWAGGAEITLTFQEFELLAFLSAHPATVFTRADLLARVWQPDRDKDRDQDRDQDRDEDRDQDRDQDRDEDRDQGRNVRHDSRTVDVHVSRLRRKLGPVHGQCLVTEHRAGYQFRPLTP